MKLLARAALAAVSLAHLAASAEAQWRESSGGPLARFSTDEVDGPRVAPVERWRVAFDAILSEPVVEKGVVYVVARRARTEALVMLDLESGKELTKTKIRCSGRVGVSVDGSQVAVATGTEIVLGEFRGGKYRRTRVIRGDFTGVVSLREGIVVAPTADGPAFFAAATGKEIGTYVGSAAKPLLVPITEVAGKSRYLTVLLGGDGQGAAQVVTVVGEREPTSSASIYGIHSIDGEHYRTKRAASEGSWMLQQVLHQLYDNVTFVLGSIRPTGVSKIVVVTGGIAGSAQFELECVGAPVAWRDQLIHRTGDRGVMNFIRPGSSAHPNPRAETGVGLPLVEGAHLPAGAVDGPMSAARDVLLLGNWAIEIESRRVLWVAPGLDVVGRPIPAADGVIVFEGEDHALVCAAATPVAASTAGMAPGAALASEGAPGDGPAVVTRAGVRRAGRAAAEGTLVRLLDADGAERGCWERVELAAIEGDAGLVEVDVPHCVFGAADRALRSELWQALVASAEESARMGLVANAERLVLEMERLGANPEALTPIRNVLATKRELRSATRDVKLAKVNGLESEARSGARERRIRRARWLAEQGLAVQAAALIGDHWIDGGGAPKEPLQDAATEEFARSLMPKGESDLQAWLVRARGLAPSDARPASKEELKEIKAQSSAWRRAVVLRSPNVLLLSKCEDLDVIAGVLLFGETTITALDRVLGGPAGGSAKPLEVRLHATREAYLAEKIGGEAVAPGWSAGYYDALLRTSRFFVPDVEPGRLDRELYQVVAHELTHQYIVERWGGLGDTRLRTPIVPGFWIVEGFASFIGDQSVEMSRFGVGLDDPTVESIEIAAALHAEGKLIPLADLLRMRQLDMFALQGDAVTVNLAYQRVSYDVDPLSGFYSQSAALMYFLMNRAGPGVRAKAIEAVREHYLGRSKPDGWGALGFESLEELESAFHGFLLDPLLPDPLLPDTGGTAPK